MLKLCDIRKEFTVLLIVSWYVCKMITKNWWIENVGILMIKFTIFYKFKLLG